MSGQVPRLEREMDPAPLQTDSSVPRAIQQVGSQEAANIVEDRRLAGWMEAVAPKIHPHSSDFKAACVAAHAGATLEDVHRAIAARRQHAVARPLVSSPAATPIVLRWLAGPSRRTVRR